MKQDEFTKSLKKILSLYGNEYKEIAGKLTQKIFEHMQAGDSVARAYKKALKEIPFGKLNASAVEDAVYEAALKGYGITAPDVFAGVEGEGALRHSLMEVAWNKDGMNLSTRLHGVDNVLHNNIKSTVQRSLNAYKTIQQTANALYDGYGTPEDVLNEAELPKYLEKIKSLTTKLYSGDVQAAKESEIYKAAVHDLNKLKTPGMRAAYNDVVEAATSDSKSAERKARKMTKLGASKEEVDKMLAAEREKALNKALDVAAQEKTRYYAERIARTESARAYYEGQMAQAMNDEDVFGFQWRLSSAHVHDKDDCDCYSYSDMDIGYGKGIFPKTEVPELPAHPNCMCHLKEVFVWQVKKTNGKDKLPEQKRGKNRVQEAADGILAGGTENRIAIKASMQEIEERDLELYRKLQESLPKTYKEWPDLEKPRTIEECAFYSNIKYGNGQVGTNNCQRCVIAYDMQRRGKNAVAQRIYGNWDNDKLSRHIDLAYVNAKTILNLPGNGKAGIESLMGQWGDKSRAIVNVSSNRLGIRHDFIAENVGGKVVYVDPQSGIVGSEVEKIFESVKMDMTEIMRIDNLKLNNDYLRKTCEVWSSE